MHITLEPVEMAEWEAIPNLRRWTGCVTMGSVRYPLDSIFKPLPGHLRDVYDVLLNISPLPLTLKEFQEIMLASL